MKQQQEKVKSLEVLQENKDYNQTIVFSSKPPDKSSCLLPVDQSLIEHSVQQENFSKKTTLVKQIYKKVLNQDKYETIYYWSRIIFLFGCFQLNPETEALNTTEKLTIIALAFIFTLLMSFLQIFQFKFKKQENQYQLIKPFLHRLPGYFVLLSEHMFIIGIMILNLNLIWIVINLFLFWFDIIQTKNRANLVVEFLNQNILNDYSASVIMFWSTILIFLGISVSKLIIQRRFPHNKRHRVIMIISLGFLLILQSQVSQQNVQQMIERIIQNEKERKIQLYLLVFFQMCSINTCNITWLIQKCKQKQKDNYKSSQVTIQSTLHLIISAIVQCLFILALPLLFNICPLVSNMQRMTYVYEKQQLNVIQNILLFIVLLILIYGLSFFAWETRSLFNQEIRMKSPILQKYLTSLVPLTICIIVSILYPEFQKLSIFFFISFQLILGIQIPLLYFTIKQYKSKNYFKFAAILQLLIATCILQTLSIWLTSK